MPSSLLVALATYNERENLPSLVDAIFEALPQCRIVVVDDNSPDGTGKWCDDFAAKDNRLHCIHRSGKLGLGTATIAAMHYAIENSFEVLVTMDADWSHHPEQLPDLVNQVKTVDVAVGSRYCPGGAIEGWPLPRRIISRTLNFMGRVFIGLPVRDASGAFRAYQVQTLREISLEDIRATGYAYLEEILWILKRNGATFAEVPITFRQRREGNSKTNWQEAWGKICVLVRLFFAR